MTFRQAKELLDELKLRDLDAEKINKLINDLHTENQISSLPTTIEAEFDKFKSSFRSILEGAGNTQENISNAMSECRPNLRKKRTVKYVALKLMIPQK